MKQVREKTLLFVLSVLMLVASAGSAWAFTVTSLTGPATSYVGETKRYTITHDAGEPVTVAWVVQTSVNGSNQTVASYNSGTTLYIDIPFIAIAGNTLPATRHVMCVASLVSKPSTQAPTNMNVLVSPWPVPTLGIGSPSLSLTKAGPITYTVTYTDADTVTLANAGVTLNKTGTANGTAAVLGTGNSTRTINISGITGNGTLGISIAAGTASNMGSSYAAVAGPSTIFTVDNTVPVTTINTKPDAISNAANAIFTFSASETSTFQCQINGGSFSACTSPKEYANLTTGNHTFSVKATDTAGNAETTPASYPWTISTIPTTTLGGPRSSIEGKTERYTVTINSSDPVTIEWYVNGVKSSVSGTQIDVPFATPGDYNVAVTVYPTAYPVSKKTITIPVIVSPYPSPTIKYVGPRSSVEGKTERYTATFDTKDPVTIEWYVNGVKSSVSGTQIDVPFATPGTYDIAVTVIPTAYPNSKATITIPVIVSVLRAPLVGLSTTKRGEVGFPMTLLATVKSQDIPSIPLVVKWEMPDGTIANTLTATYTPRLEDMGKATFKFSAYPEGYPNSKKEATLQVPIEKYEFPTFTLKNYTKKTGIVPHYVLYAADARIQSITEILTYSWNMGDGTVMPNKSKAAHTYTVVGEYPVTLTVTDTKGNSKVLTDTVTVTSVEAISIDSITVKGTNKYMRAPVTGIFKAVISGGNPKVDRFATYAWTVNGQPIGRNSSMTTHTFMEPGTNIVGLTVTSKNGLTGSGTTTVVINDNIVPECAIEATDFPSKKYTKLVAQCTDTDGRIRALSWDLGNGQTSKVQTVYAKYAESGNYTVSLTGTDDSGGTVTVSKDVAVQR